MRAVHISSVHPSEDPRIRRKQISALLGAGWHVTFVTGDMSAKPCDAANVVRVSPGRTSRLARLFLTSPRCIVAAWRENADIYHFHDPELIPWAWLLLLKGKPVVYDIHEDYRTSLLQKEWIPQRLRKIVACVGDFAERIGSRPFTKIIAERYYKTRFPGSFEILNYSVQVSPQIKISHRPGSNRLLYTGNVTPDRGALNMAALVKARVDLNVTIVGRCSPEMAAQLRHIAHNHEGLTLVGEGRYVPFQEIARHYESGGWLAGIALFPDTEHYRQKELTKFFEYMSAGLPIIASRFPAWERLIESQGVGLCVDPANPDSVGEAVDWLLSHPVEGLAMSRRGQALVREKYNWEHEGRRLIELYAQLAS